MVFSEKRPRSPRSPTPRPGSPSRPSGRPSCARRRPRGWLRPKRPEAKAFKAPLRSSIELHMWAYAALFGLKTIKRCKKLDFKWWKTSPRCHFAIAPPRRHGLTGGLHVSHVPQQVTHRATFRAQYRSIESYLKPYQTTSHQRCQ